MYTEYWQLESKPFEPLPADGEPFLGEGFEGALLKTRYACEAQREAVALAGPSGVGKTLLLDTLAARLAETGTQLIHLRFPQLSPRELLSWIAVELGAPPSDSPAADTSLRNIETQLADRATSGKHTVLAVDEAHLLEDSGLLETLRLVGNLARDGRPLATLLLSGQPELLSAIGRQAALAQRVGQVALLNGLDDLQVRDYLLHRLNVAGSQQTVFTDDGIAELCRQTGGIPRLINRLADLALVVGFAEGAAQVDADLVRSVASELSLLRAA